MLTFTPVVYIDKVYSTTAFQTSDVSFFVNTCVSSVGRSTDNGIYLDAANVIIPCGIGK